MVVFVLQHDCIIIIIIKLPIFGGSGVVVRLSVLGSKGPGFDPRAVPKSECMFVNI